MILAVKNLGKSLHTSVFGASLKRLGFFFIELFTQWTEPVKKIVLSYLVKFMFSKKATKMTKSSPLIWHCVVSVKLTVKTLSIFVAFLENANFSILGFVSLWMNAEIFLRIGGHSKSLTKKERPRMKRCPLKIMSFS